MEFLVKLRKKASLAHRQGNQDNAPESSLEVRSEERCGLFILADETSGQTNAIDIIAVHGLGGHWKSTWTDESGKLWLRDFLPHQLRESAIYVRIMTYGYNSDTAFSKAVTDIDDEAAMLLDRIDGERQSQTEKQRPIIFVSHSLGGIIVKKAMILSHERSAEYGQLLSCIRGSVFLGVPHRGADAAYWATFAATLLRFGQLGFGTNTAYVSALQKNSTTFANISRQFVERAVQLKIRTFFETEKMAGQLIVDKDSAVLGLPNEVAIGVASASHKTICKFGNAESQKYKPVWIAIRSMAETILDEPRSRPRFSQPESTCIQLLYKSDYGFQRERIPLRAPGTCEWITNHEKYRTWRQDQKSSVLWISGPPGCGKSTLASFVVDKLSAVENPRDMPRMVLYFFFNVDNENEKSAGVAICTFLHQLFTAEPDLVKYALPDYQAKSDKFTMECGTLWKIFTAACMDHRCGNTWCILDGLDQCEEKSRDQLTRCLANYFGQSRVTSGKALKFLLTARPYTFIDRQLEEFCSSRIQVEEEMQVIEFDVTRLIRHRLENIKRIKNISEGVRESIESRLIESADRTFIWVALVLDLIERSDRSSRAALEELVTSIPPKLDALYEKILHSCSSSADVRKMLHIIIAATRPLSLQEINVAFSITETNRSSDDLDLEPAIEVTIRGICGLFVRTVASRVFLVHKTAREFLVKQGHESSPAMDTWKQSFDLTESNSIMAKVCIQYLMLHDFDTAPFQTREPMGHEVDTEVPFVEKIDHEFPGIVKTQIARHVFLEYASKNWAKHFHEGNEDPRLLESALTLCDVTSERYATWETVFADFLSAFPVVRLPSDLIVGAFFGLESVVQRLLELGSDMNMIGIYGTALQTAAMTGHEGTVELLIEHAAAVNPDARAHSSAIASAAFIGHIGIVRLLLRHGAEVSTSNGEHALDSAALGGSEVVVRLLLENGADVNTRSPDGDTALQSASVGGHRGVAQLLIQNGAEVNAFGGLFGSPLHAAAHKGHESIVRLLLESGADINAQHWTYGSPLQAAASGGNSAIVRLLIQNGAQLNHLGGIYGSALHAAACEGHVGATELLLNSGADINAVAGEFGDVLETACFAGREETARLLLANGAKVRTQGGAYGNALQVAVSRNYEALAITLLGLGVDVNGSGAVYLADEEAEYLMPNVFTERARRAGQGIDIPRIQGTALHLAAAHGNLVLVRLLMENGAGLEAFDQNETTPLHIAAALGYDDVVGEMLNRGTNPMARDGRGCTALHLAAYFGMQEIIQKLIQTEVDIGAANEDGSTALHVAATRGHEGAAQQLLENGADIAARDEGGSTPLHLASLLGHDAVVRQLIDNGADTMARDMLGAVALHAAAVMGCASVLRVLISYGVDIRATNGTGLTALHLAARGGHEETIRLLLENGADVTMTSDSGLTALHLAAVQGHQASVNQLLENGADIAAADENGSTALDLASSQGHEEVVRQLISNGLDVCRDGTTALHEAAMEGHDEIVRMLLEHGADTAARDDTGSTALLAAALSGHQSTVKVLLENGADINAANEDGFTPLYAAVEQRHEPLVKLLILKGADVSVRSSEGLTPLNLASWYGHVEVVKVLLTTGNADPDSAYVKYGRTPLSFAAGNGHEPVAKLLLTTADVDPNSKDNIGRTPLFYAAQNGHRKLVELLLADTRVDPDSPDHYSSTPLLTAVANGQGEVVDVLIGTDRINMDCKDRFGRTPLSWVRRTGNAQTMKLLAEGSEKNRVLIGENEPIVEKEPLQNDEVPRGCDVCTVGIPKGDAYHECGICNHGDFDICAECFEIGACCLDESHRWIVKMDGEAMP